METSSPETGSLPSAPVIPAAASSIRLSESIRKVPESNDLLPGREPLDDFNPVAQPPAGFHLPGFKKPVALIDKDRFFKPGIEDRI